jgi:hypothetical protein
VTVRTLEDGEIDGKRRDREGVTPGGLNLVTPVASLGQDRSLVRVPLFGTWSGGGVDDGDGNGSRESGRSEFDDNSSRRILNGQDFDGGHGRTTTTGLGLLGLERLPGLNFGVQLRALGLVEVSEIRNVSERTTVVIEITRGTEVLLAGRRGGDLKRGTRLGQAEDRGD